VKLEFFKRSAEDQALIIRETAARRGLHAVMVEKDFWVSWTLAVLFAHPEFGSQLVFKGGTSLSKVFGVIRRFSEDIDLSVSPAFLGIEEQYVEEAKSRTKAAARMEELEAASIECIRERFVPELERIAGESLGEQFSGASWMKFQIDPVTDSPVVLFRYPSNEPTGFDYLRCGHISWTSRRRFQALLRSFCCWNGESTRSHERISERAGLETDALAHGYRRLVA